MANVSKKRIRKEVYSKTSSLTDKEFFLSRGFKEYAQDVVDAITLSWARKYKVVINYTETNDTAATEHKTILLNANNPWAKGKKRPVKFNISKALLAHECAHNLYTDFALMKKAQEEMINNKILFPEPDVEEIPEYEKVKAFLGKYGSKPIMGLWFHLLNSIEDGYIESRIVEDRPGYKKALKVKRDEKYAEWDSYEKQVDNGIPRSSIMLSLIFIYASYGCIKCESSSLESEDIKTLLSLDKTIKKAVRCRIPELRLLAINELFCKIFFLIEDIMEEKKAEKESSESVEEESSEEESSGSGESSEDSESEESESEDSESEESESEESESEDSESEESESEESESEESESEDKEFSEEEMEEMITEALKKAGVSEEEMKEEMSESRSSSAVSESPEDDGEISKSECEDSSDGSAIESTMVESVVYKPEEPDDSEDDTDAGIEMIEREAAEEIVENAIEEEIERELVTADKDIDYDPSFHRKRGCMVIREKPSEAAIERYDSYAAPLLVKSKTMERELKKQIKDCQDGGKLDGLYNGQRIDAHSLTRTDKKFFYRNILPEDIPDMAVCLLIDESGSMTGPRIEAARKTAIVLYDFCTKCGIPICIIGHTEEYYGESRVKLTSYAEYDSVDKMDKYRLMHISAKENNRDGYALKYCAERLEKRNEDTKLLFVISDGQPAAENYGITNGKADIQKVVSDYRKKGMFIITAGIGSDRNQVEYVYNSGLSAKRSATYLDISDMEKLPKTFIKIVKKFLERAM